MAFRFPFPRPLVTTVRFRLIGLTVGLMVAFVASCVLFLAYIGAQRSEHRALEEQERRLTTIAEVGTALLTARQASTAANNARINHQPNYEEIAQVADAKFAEFFTAVELVGAFDLANRDVIRSSAATVWRELADRAYQEYVSQAEEKPALMEIQQRMARVEAALAASAHLQKLRSDEIRQGSEDRAQLGMRVAIVLTAVTAIAMLLVVLTVLRSILKPMGVVIEAVRQVNAGQTLLDLPSVEEGEFGDVAMAVRHFRSHAEKLQRQAYRDTLTGIGNRTFLGEKLEAALARCSESQKAVALVYVDLDRFRLINERVGDHFADRFLCECANRLARFAPQDAEVFRYAADKFVVMIEDLENSPLLRTQLQTDAELLMRSVHEPFPIGTEIIQTTATIGISIAPEDGSTAELLIRSAEAGLSTAKKAGRNKIRFASGSQTAAARARAALATDISRGISAGEFELFYQPIVDFARRQSIAAEALIRWRHPTRGLILAGDFIDVAEEEGLIVRLGEEILRLAHAQARAWEEQGFEIRLAVNVSARQLQEGLIEKLEALQGPSGTVPCRIDLELTESALFDHTENTRAKLLAIKKMGYRLGLDDFGTGYSSLSYLLRLPIDKIKIDRQFVADIARNNETMAVIGATLTLARVLRLEVIAEGVETEEQAHLLVGQGCALLQGFHFSPALPGAEFEAWVQQYNKKKLGVS